MPGERKNDLATKKKQLRKTSISRKNNVFYPLVSISLSLVSWETEREESFGERGVREDAVKPPDR